MFSKHFYNDYSAATTSRSTIQHPTSPFCLMTRLKGTKIRKYKYRECGKFKDLLCMCHLINIKFVLNSIHMAKINTAWLAY